MKRTPPGILAQTLAIVCTVVFTLAAAFIAASYALVTTRFQAIEAEEAAVNLDRVTNEAANSLKEIEAAVTDWAPWDETYAFVGQVNGDYMERNLTSESFQNLQLHFMLFFDADNTLAHQQFHDLDAQKNVPPDPRVVPALQALPQLFKHASGKDGKSGIVMIGASPALLASAPIVTSTFEGPIRGTLIFGRYLDQTKMAQIAAQTRLAAQMQPITDDRAPLFGQSCRQIAAPADHQTTVCLADADTLQGSVLVNDLAGRPAVLFTVALERKLFRQGLTMWREQAITMLVMGGLFILVLVLLLHRRILRRLTALTDQVAAIAEDGGHEARVTADGGDEIGQLASRINAMLTALRGLQETRQKNEQHLNNIIDSVNCGILIVNAEDRRIVSINKTGAALLHRPTAEIVGKICHQFVCPREWQDCPVLDGGECVDLSERAILRADGSQLPVLKSVAVVEQDGQRLLIESFIDVSELQQAQQALQSSEARYRQFFEEDLTGNFICALDGTILDCNPAFAAMLGYQSPAAVIGANIRNHYFTPENRTALLERLQEERRISRHEGTLRHRNGHPVYCVCNLIGEFDEQGALTRTRGHLFDDTKRVELAQQIRQAQKLEAIGALAGGIAHDFNNILGGIMGYTEIVLATLDQDPTDKNHQRLHNILTAGERAKGLIQKILTFSRGMDAELRPIQLQRTLDEVLQLIRASLPATIAIEQRLYSQANVLADPIQLHQVFMNLCTNAGHAMQERGGTLSVNLDELDLDAAFAERCPEIVPGPYLRVEVIDTGEGIPGHLLDRIFDPFFTTKKKGEGTGLGLSMVHGIIRGMNGLITVTSEPGQGVCCTLYLPKADKEEDAIAPEPQALAVGGEQVVYVDDEVFLVDIGVEILRSFGYQATGFTDSEEALHYLLAHAPKVDLVISDMTMPKRTGLELAQGLQQLDAPPPVIICTGHNEGLAQSDLAAMGIHALLLKPVTAGKLAKIVRSVLDENRAKKQSTTFFERNIS